MTPLEALDSITELLNDSSAEMKDYIKHMYGETIHPANERKYQRDMDFVRQIEYAVSNKIHLIREALPQWRSIEEAPKDGTYILGYDYGMVTTVFYYYGKWEMAVCGSYTEDTTWEPTHWQPLPKPPEEV